jgi:hypothetical protein
MKLEDRMIDIEKREEGAWVKDIPEFNGVELLICGSGNKKWARLQKKLFDAIPRQRRISGTVLPDELLLLQGKLILETALLDWRGIENGNGEPIPYSKEQAAKYLTDPRFEPFIKACVWAADVVAESGNAEIEADAKN